MLTQDVPGGLRVWLPLPNGTERLGVLGLTVPTPAGLDDALAANLPSGAAD